MSKSTPAKTQAPSPTAEPSQTLVGMQNTPQGWVVVSAVVTGTRVDSMQAHCPPQPKQFAAIILKKILTQKVLFPKGR